jgi:UDP-N-acetylglucosamine 1-carboxyvinyltransferase
MSYMQQIGDIIRALREQKGLTQRELAQMLGSKQPYINRIEQGKQSISIRQLHKIASALDCYLDIRITSRKE